jgi:hypothetical protein
MNNGSSCRGCHPELPVMLRTLPGRQFSGAAGR